MINFLKNYALLIFLILFIGLYAVNNYFITNYKTLYKKEGIYVVGTINTINTFGRSGHNFVYTFNVNGKKYKSVCSTGNLSSDKFNEYMGKSFLVLYLNSNIHNNRLYVSIPVNSTDDEKTLIKIVNKNIYTKRKLDSIPYPGLFWENYF